MHCVRCECVECKDLNEIMLVYWSLDLAGEENIEVHMERLTIQALELVRCISFLLKLNELSSGWYTILAP